MPVLSRAPTSARVGSREPHHKRRPRLHATPLNVSKRRPRLLRSEVHAEISSGASRRPRARNMQQRISKRSENARRGGRPSLSGADEANSAPGHFRRGRHEILVTEQLGVSFLLLPSPNPLHGRARFGVRSASRKRRSPSKLNAVGGRGRHFDEMSIRLPMVARAFTALHAQSGLLWNLKVYATGPEAAQR